MLTMLVWFVVIWLGFRLLVIVGTAADYFSKRMGPAFPRPKAHGNGPYDPPISNERSATGWKRDERGNWVPR